MQEDVFISYSSKDIEIANFVKAVLDKNYISCWMAPASIPGGSNYAKEIPRAIQNCKVFLLILSSKTQESSWVPAEIESAVKYKKIIIPYVIEKCTLSAEFDFMLSRSQRIEAYAKKDVALHKLVSILNNIIQNNDKIQKISVETKKTKRTKNKKVISIAIIIFSLSIIVFFIMLYGALVKYFLFDNVYPTMQSTPGNSPGSLPPPPNPPNSDNFLTEILQRIISVLTDITRR